MNSFTGKGDILLMKMISRRKDIILTDCKNTAVETSMNYIYAWLLLLACWKWWIERKNSFLIFKFFCNSVMYTAIFLFLNIYNVQITQDLKTAYFLTWNHNFFAKYFIGHQLQQAQMKILCNFRNMSTIMIFVFDFV